MKMLYDVSDEVIKCVKDGTWCGSPMVEKMIATGIPLPKGHGRLKDVDKIIRDGRSRGFCDWYDEMKYADTIIEADIESEAQDADSY